MRKHWLASLVNFISELKIRMTGVLMIGPVPGIFVQDISVPNFKILLKQHLPLMLIQFLSCFGKF